MKKIFALLIGIISSMTIIYPQNAPPKAFSYQAVIMKANGNAVLSNTTISFRISILQGSTIGVPVYNETDHPTTDSNGQINIVIGGSAGLPYIDWSNGPYFLKAEVDIKGGTNYQVLSTTQLLSVPYALYAGGADYNNLLNKPTLFDGTWLSLGGKPTTIAGYGITDAFNGQWSSLTGKPTTVSGYGITDAVTIAGDQTIGGNKTFSNDLLINGLTAGKGKGAVSTNTAVGYQVLYSNTTGNYNTANGSQVLYSNKTGSYNTANGCGALYSNTTGSYNIANGIGTLYMNTTGTYNIATGSYALMGNTTGNYNTAVGGAAMWVNTEGSFNTAIGNDALKVNVTGNYNTGIGSQAGNCNRIGNSNVFLGYSAGFWETGSNKLFIDNRQRADEIDERNKALIYGVFDADPANQVLAVNGTLQMQDLNITNLANPVNAQDAATKAYVDASSGGATTHKIGDSYGGGIVFYVTPNGYHGLISEKSDLFEYGNENGDFFTPVSWWGAQSYVSDPSWHSTEAQNYTDWRLPTKYELNLLYQQKNVVGGFSSLAYYMSSTESLLPNSFTASLWVQDFITGNQKQLSLVNNLFFSFVRCIRSF